MSAALWLGLAPFAAGSFAAGCAAGVDASGDSPNPVDAGKADAKIKDASKDSRTTPRPDTSTGDDDDDDDDATVTGDDDDDASPPPGDDDDDDDASPPPGDDDDASPPPTGNCSGLTEWTAGTTAQEVQHHGQKYRCLVPGWCSQTGSAAIAAYEPGTGSAWTQAWQSEGSCP
jgi:hypothetical protein